MERESRKATSRSAKSVRIRRRAASARLPSKREPSRLKPPSWMVTPAGTRQSPRLTPRVSRTTAWLQRLTGPDSITTTPPQPRSSIASSTTGASARPRRASAAPATSAVPGPKRSVVPASSTSRTPSGSTSQPATSKRPGRERSPPEAELGSVSRNGWRASVSARVGRRSGACRADGTLGRAANSWRRPSSPTLASPSTVHGRPLVTGSSNSMRSGRGASGQRVAASRRGRRTCALERNAPRCSTSGGEKRSARMWTGRDRTFASSSQPRPRSLQRRARSSAG